MKRKKRLLPLFLAAGFLLVGCQTAEESSEVSSSTSDATSAEEAEEGIQEVKALAFVDLDGIKANGVAIRYNQDMKGANLSLTTYTLSVYDPKNYEEVGEGTVGEILAYYVNDTAEVTDNPSGEGEYVILELNADYRATTELAIVNSLNIHVTQSEDIVTDAGTVSAKPDKVYSTISGGKKIVNFYCPDIDNFHYYTNNTQGYQVDGPAFHADNCFSTIDGTYKDEDLSYALALPDNYSSDGKYGLVTIDNPATTAGSHPLLSVVQTRSPAVMASDWAQNFVKEKFGLDGLIVVVPVITEGVHNNGSTPAEYEALVRLFDYLLDTYAIDPGYIYGIGQSVGGMELAETNRIRDNFFAGLLMYEDQWVQNYYIDTTHQTGMATSTVTETNAPFQYPRIDDDLIWNYHYDSEGNKVTTDHDPYNYYYLVSDDNILAIHTDGNHMAIGAFQEMHYLYYDLTGYNSTYLEMDASASLSEQETTLTNYLNRGEEKNINSVTLSSASNGYSARKLFSAYEWLLSQSQASEISRGKLDLNKPFALAETQDTSEARQIPFTTKDGNPVLLLTGKSGAGTRFYNSAWMNTFTVADALPGWLPEGMSWDNGVGEAKIVSATRLSEKALAIQYDQDMSGLVFHLKGDPVVTYYGNETTKTILYDPYRLYGLDGTVLDVAISNLYINTTATTLTDATRGTGSGNYVILEYESDVSSVSSLLQLTTMYTPTAFAMPSSTLYTIGR